MQFVLGYSGFVSFSLRGHGVGFKAEHVRVRTRVKVRRISSWGDDVGVTIMYLRSLKGCTWLEWLLDSFSGPDDRNGLYHASDSFLGSTRATRPAQN